METPSFQIKALNGMKLPIEQYEPDLTVKELTDMVINHLEYPLFDGSRKEIEYFLENSKGERLPKSATLMQAGVTKDEVLELRASADVTVSRAIPSPPAPGMVNAYVQLMDLNRTELDTFGLDKRVGDILNEIIKKHRLPTRDEKLKEGKFYELISKTSGDALHEGTTLRDAKVPNLDTFIVSTKEIPG